MTATPTRGWEVHPQTLTISHLETTKPNHPPTALQMPPHSPYPEPNSTANASNPNSPTEDRQ